MSNLLQGKTVLITGASRGVGATLACALARQGASKLILVSEEGSQDKLHQTKERCKAEGSQCDCQCLPCDLADAWAVQALADKALAGGDVHVAIMNAGVFVENDNPLQGNSVEWDCLMKINAMAPMRLIRCLAPKMADKGEGWLICIGDVEAVHTGPSHAAYAASKYAMRGFCKSAYEALRPHGIKVMNIAAGNVSRTGMAEQTGKQGGQGVIDPEDVAEAVLLAFRCSSNCVPEEIILEALSPSAGAS